MKALILAAGKGERMRPLTEHTPKPLLPVGGKRLIEWHLQRLARAGIADVVINTSWLAPQFPAALGDGSRWQTRLHFSHEGAEPLETGGGMLHALELLGREPFLAVNGDVYCDVDFSTIELRDNDLAHLLMVDNPEHHRRGDFRLDAAGRLHGVADGDTTARLTYAGIGLFDPALLDDWHDVIGDSADARQQPPRFRLAPLLLAAMTRQRVAGTHYRGLWTDVGTPQRLAELDAQLLGRGA